MLKIKTLLFYISISLILPGRRVAQEIPVNFERLNMEELRLSEAHGSELSPGEDEEGADVMSQACFDLVPAKYILCSGIEQGDESSYGQRFFLYNSQGSLLDKTVHQGDSYVFNPSFYKYKDQLFIFGELGTEYSWGFSNYRYGSGRLFDTGDLNYDTYRESDIDPHIDLLDVATLAAIGNRAYLFIESDLLYDPGGLKEKKVDQPAKGRLFSLFKLSRKWRPKAAPLRA